MAAARTDLPREYLLLHPSTLNNHAEYARTLRRVSRSDLDHLVAVLSPHGQQAKKHLPFFDNAYQVGARHLHPPMGEGLRIPCLYNLVGGYVLTADVWDWVVQGYATGSLSEDAYSLRHFADQGMQLLCACSFAKNMGLYGTHTSRSRSALFSLSRK